jgi:hypothetical protein
MGLILVVLFAWFMVNRQAEISISGLAQEAIAPYPIGENRIALPAEVITLYEAGNFQAAAALFDEENLSLTESFFLANCLLQLQQRAESVTQLSKFLASSLISHPLKQSAEYYLALAYLTNGEEDAGKALLGLITATAGHSHSQEAAILLEKISKGN